MNKYDIDLLFLNNLLSKSLNKRDRLEKTKQEISDNTAELLAELETIEKEINIDLDNLRKIASLSERRWDLRKNSLRKFGKQIFGTTAILVLGLSINHITFSYFWSPITDFQLGGERFLNISYMIIGGIVASWQLINASVSGLIDSYLMKKEVSELDEEKIKESLHHKKSRKISLASEVQEYLKAKDETQNNLDKTNELIDEIETKLSELSALKQAEIDRLVASKEPYMDALYAEESIASEITLLREKHETKTQPLTNT